jgi:hypothetical protein
MSRHQHICGVYFVTPGPSPQRTYLPQLSLSVKSKIVSSTSRTTLTQTFVNPKWEPISELRYTFPLYEGVSVVGFVCTINGDRVIRGVVKERAEAKKTFKAAVDRGETAGLLEQLPQASDVFTTTIGNVPANARLEVDITYLGELKHDAEVDGIRFTIPTHIAPRYGSYPGQLLQSSAVNTKGGISIVVDVEMPNGSNVKNVQSPSHPISVTLGNTSIGAASGADMSLQKASATLALSTAELGDDFVLQVVATNTSNPVAVLETHPTIPNHRALMATLVPKFNLPSSRPEIVFLCDRSGSMMGTKTANLKTALHVFLKSLPVGVKFNICSFGSRHEFLFPNGSRTYDESALEEATRYVDNISANFGGTDIYDPMEAVIEKRYTDMDLEVFLLTDGEIWDQAALFELLNKHIAESNGRIRVFTLGIGSDVSHALIEGVAAAGNGFSQAVGDNENMNSKVVRMLKASLTPHIRDYTLEIRYNKEPADDSEDDFELVEKVMDALAIEVQEPEKADAPQKTISLFDESADLDVEMTDANLDTSAGGKYSHLPPVPEPKILQAPFIIPPLYPFNRTSVYLLLSPETIQKQPKSVVLRGTSPYGPVELEIPVTVLLEKGETLHQLAARKAVKELEDGRGWIFHAKDAKDAANALLKDKYPGRFSDMVEREAVRLGVTYQVGGKWCSFVAVEANTDGSEKAEVQPSAPSSPDSESRYRGKFPPPRELRALVGSIAMIKTDQVTDRDTLNFNMSASRSLFRGRPGGKSLLNPQPTDTRNRSRLLTAPSLVRHRALPEAARKAAPVTSTAAFSWACAYQLPVASDDLDELEEPAASSPPGSLFGLASAQQSGPPLDTVSERRNPMLFGGPPRPTAPMQPQPTGSLFGAVGGGGSSGGLFGSAAPPPPPPPSAAAPAPAPAPSLFGNKPGISPRDSLAPTTSSFGTLAQPQMAAARSPFSHEDYDEARDLRRLQREMASGTLHGADKLKYLVTLQSFSGAWRWGQELLLVLGLGARFVAPARLGGACDKLATALVLGCLEGELSGLRDEWEMMAEKAREWLRGVLEGRETLEGYYADARALLRI